MPSSPFRVAYQGAPGAYSDEAITALWPEAGRAPARTFAEVVRLVERGDADACVLPIENSIVGEVAASLEAIAGAPGLELVGEVVIPIRHCLLALPGATIDGVRSAESHPVALAQCGGFLARHPWIAPREAYDTAGAAAAVADAGDRTRGAIASAAAAARHGLVVLADGIADRDDNRTRFVALVRHDRRGDAIAPRQGSSAGQGSAKSAVER